MVRNMLSDTFTKMKQIWSRFATKEYRDAFVRSHLVTNVASQIFALRERSGMTQQQLADSAGMAQTRISVLENGSSDNFTVSTLAKIASALDVAVVVRFVPFSDVVRWVSESSEESLAPPCFKKDSLAAALSLIKPNVAISSQGASFDDLYNAVLMSKEQNLSAIEAYTPIQNEYYLANNLTEILRTCTPQLEQSHVH